MLRKRGIRITKRALYTRDDKFGRKVTWTRGAGAIDAKVHGVCSKCNNEWLGQWETAYVKPFLSKMILGEPTVLTLEMQVALAAWLTRLAMVREFMGTNVQGPFFFSQRDREAFWAEPIPPVETWIWLAVYSGKEVADVDQHHLILESTDGRPNCVHLLTTGAVGRFAYQVFTRRRDKSRLDRQITKRLADMRIAWGSALVQLWPFHSENLLWGRSAYLDDNGLYLLGERLRARGTATWPPQRDTL